MTQDTNEVAAVTISVRWSTLNEGWAYDVHLAEVGDIKEPESDHGGLCTGSMQDAINLAVMTAQSVVRSVNPAPYPCAKSGCGYSVNLSDMLTGEDGEMYCQKHGREIIKENEDE